MSFSGDDSFDEAYQRSIETKEDRMRRLVERYDSRHERERERTARLVENFITHDEREAANGRCLAVDFDRRHEDGERRYRGY